MSSPTITVLLADDQHLVRSGLRLIVHSEPDLEVVGEAADGVEAVEATIRLRPAVVLMDVRMPRMNGIDATARLQGLVNPPKVIVLTTFDHDRYVYEALRNGASGFLLKDAPERQLLSAIRGVVDGASLLAPGVTRRLVDSFASVARPAQQPPVELDRLTAREIEILRQVARGLSNAAIAAEFYLSEATVKTHVARILAKLGLTSRTQAVVVAYESRLISPGPS
jgi:DNA-binding NarL/FixJ family response regulator